MLYATNKLRLSLYPRTASGSHKKPILSAFCAQFVRSALFSLRPKSQKVGSEAEALCLRLQRHSRSKRDFLRKRSSDGAFRRCLNRKRLVATVFRQRVRLQTSRKTERDLFRKRRGSEAANTRKKVVVTAKRQRVRLQTSSFAERAFLRKRSS